MNAFPVFGIHIGNSSICMALCRLDDPTFKLNVEVMANNAGERIMPALITFRGNEFVVGTPCKTLMTTHWNTTITCNKRMLNMVTPEVINGERRVNTILSEGELLYELPSEDRVHHCAPSVIAMYIFETLFEIADTVAQGIGFEKKCVLMLPRHFSDNARFRYNTAASNAGWEVLQVMNECVSPVLAYNLLRGKDPPPPQTVLMFRAGGRTCECTLIQLRYGFINTMDSIFLDDVGGKMIINSLAQYMADEFYRKHKLNPRESHRSMTKLTVAAQDCLHLLSSIQSVTCFVESLQEGVDLSFDISRGRFESLLYPHLTKFEKPVHDILSKQRFSPNNVAKVLLCGGLMKIPRLNKAICDIFSNSPTTEIVSLPNGINYDEVLACGAALQAGHVMERFQDYFPLTRENDLPTLDGPVLLEVEGGYCEPMELEEGLPLPTSKTFTIDYPDTLVMLSIKQRTRTGYWLFGMAKWEFENARRELNVRCEIDSYNGIRVTLLHDEGLGVYQDVNMFSELP